MTTKTAICAGLVLAALTTATSADPYRRPAVVYGVGSVPSFEIVTIVRSMNLNPIERPIRQGNTYVVRAVTFQGDMVQVVLDAQRGTVLGVSPVQAAYSPPPPGAHPLPGAPWEQPQVVRPGIYRGAPPRVVNVPPYDNRSDDQRSYGYDREPSYDPPRVITAPPDPGTTGSIYGQSRSTPPRYAAPAPQPTPLPPPRPQVASLDVAPAAPPSPPATAATPDQPAPTAPAATVDNSPVPAAPPF